MVVAILSTFSDEKIGQREEKTVSTPFENNFYDFVDSNSSVRSEKRIRRLYYFFPARRQGRIMRFNGPGRLLQ